MTGNVKIEHWLYAMYQGFITRSMRLSGAVQGYVRSIRNAPSLYTFCMMCIENVRFLYTSCSWPAVVPAHLRFITARNVTPRYSPPRSVWVIDVSEGSSRL